MYDKHYDYIFDDFRKERPRLVPDIIDWKPRGRNCISVTLRNGNKLIYNANTHNYFMDNPASAIELSDAHCVSSFGTRLTEIMKDRGLKTGDVSRFTGINPSTISNYKSGKTSPSWSNIRKLSIALSCELDEFM